MKFIGTVDTIGFYTDDTYLYITPSGAQSLWTCREISIINTTVRSLFEEDITFSVDIAFSIREFQHSLITNITAKLINGTMQILTNGPCTVDNRQSAFIRVARCETVIQTGRTDYYARNYTGTSVIKQLELLLPSYYTKESPHKEPCEVCARKHTMGITITTELLPALLRFLSDNNITASYNG